MCHTAARIWLCILDQLCSCRKLAVLPSPPDTEELHNPVEMGRHWRPQTGGDQSVNILILIEGSLISNIIVEKMIEFYHNKLDIKLARFCFTLSPQPDSLLRQK